ncbi:SDR family oxidoreductase [Bacillus salitolerans]|uniref:SDR family oxidoreductase n=1 Tax=Bacillus salitolerans TaxID=1437434 RepID=A0ABW4LTR8_9BACI
MKRDALNGKNVLITGAAGGLGTELCVAFGTRGATIIALDLDLDRLQALQFLLQEKDIQCGIFVLDITNKEQCKKTIDEIEKIHDSIDVVVHNAGVSHRSPFIDTKLDVLENVLAVNVNGPVNVTHYTLQQIIKNKGTYVAISSVAGFAPLFGRTGYAASKHALHGFFETLRSEVEDLGVKVLLVYPSFIQTGLVQNALGGDGKKVSQSLQTIGNVLTPAYVSECIVKGVLKQKKRLYISPVSKVSLWMSRIAPSCYIRLMKKKVRAEFGQNQ